MASQRLLVSLALGFVSLFVAAWYRYLSVDFQKLPASAEQHVLASDEYDEFECQCSCGGRLNIIVAEHNETATATIEDKTYWEIENYRRSNYVRIRIFNAEPDGAYSVMAVSAGRFSRPGDLERVDDGEQIYDVELPFAGNYSLLVHKVKPLPIDVKISPLIPPSPRVTVQVPHNDCAFIDRKDRMHGTLPCQAAPNNLLEEWKGEWIGPMEWNSPGSQLRSGWSFMPMQCTLETFSSGEIQRASLNNKKTSVAVLGSSVERGVFLSMVDIALRPEEKENLGVSVVGKCWGRASVQLNSGLEMIYQDYRPVYIDPYRKNGTVTCHDNRIAAMSGYGDNATAMIKELMSQPEPPDVVLLPLTCWMDQVTPSDIKQLPSACLQLFKRTLELFPPHWNGTIYVTKFAGDSILKRSKEQFEAYWYSLRWVSDYVGDNRVRFLDLSQLISGMRYYTEGQARIFGSQHHHRFCNETDDMRVCSNATEAVANLLIGRAIAPLGKHQWKNRQKMREVVHTKRKVRVCADCPASLLPFHIKPKPDLKCYDGVLAKTEIAGAAWNARPCPIDCMKTTPVGEAKTQSGNVVVRICEPN